MSETSCESGNTTCMLKEAILYLNEGQPKARIVAADEAHKKILYNKAKLIVKSLFFTICMFDVKFLDPSMKIKINGSEMLFHTFSDLENDLRGAEQYDCLFVDHFVLEKYGDEFNCIYDNLQNSLYYKNNKTMSILMEE